MKGVHHDFAFLFLDHCIRHLDNQTPRMHENFIEKYIDKLLRGEDMKRLSSLSSSNGASKSNLIFRISRGSIAVTPGFLGNIKSF